MYGATVWQLQQLTICDTHCTFQQNQITHTRGAEVELNHVLEGD
jgi:hypothetical protein